MLYIFVSFLTYTVIRLLVLLIEDGVALYHVINHIGFADLLAPELFRCAQVLSVIVTQVVVAHNGNRFDAFVVKEHNSMSEKVILYFCTTTN